MDSLDTDPGLALPSPGCCVAEGCGGDVLHLVLQACHECVNLLDRHHLFGLVLRLRFACGCCHHKHVRALLLAIFCVHGFPVSCLLWSASVVVDVNC